MHVADYTAITSRAAGQHCIVIGDCKMSASTEAICDEPQRAKAAVPSLSDGRNDSWVVSLRAGGDRPALFCACALGGDVFDYRDLAIALPQGQPVYSFGLPDSNTLAHFPTVQSIAAAYALKVREMQKRGPYHLCGHSFGGLVVYEMAAILARAREEVGVVALLDTEHPAYSRILPVKQKAEFQFVYVSDRISKYASNLRHGKIDVIFADAAQFIRSRSRRFGWRVARAIFGTLGRDVPEAIRSNALVLSGAWAAYRPREYSGRIVVLVASGRASEYRADHTLGWKSCATGSIETHSVPGDHYTMLHPPLVSVLADRLTPYLTSCTPPGRGAADGFGS